MRFHCDSLALNPFSAYYNTPVLLKVLKNEPIDSRPGERLFERQVEETCRGVVR